ncbi:(2,3-dihydroxybenzoyl)adenylate synthase [Chitinimonas lacunae]|uniref:(2,3-dihydroxybenzoyl)adenylate synthase n=1 Tax=Chitinimonas lacunae TaxID=1963018 RepID=A0ABV8MP72_9NEIS
MTLQHPSPLPGFTPWPEEFAQRYRQQGYWTGQTLGDMLREQARRHPERIALVCGQRRWDYAEFDRRADQLAAGFARLGIGARDRVVVQLPNVAEFFTVCFALFRLGALPVFALPAHRRTEIGHFCRFAQAKAYVIPDRDGGFDYRSLAREVGPEAPTLQHVVVLGEAEEFVALDSLYDAPRELVGPSADEVAFLQLSGGSTGLPKLIPRTHDDYLYSVRASADICGLDQDTVYLCALPVAHNFPLSSPGTLGVFHAGGRVVLARRPSPDDAFPLIEAERVTLTALVPPLAMAWLDAASSRQVDLSSLRLLQVGGAKLGAEAARRVQPVLGCRLQQVFGMAEGLVNYTRADDPEEIVFESQGRPISPADEVRVVDDDDRDVAPGETGHLLTRGPYTIRGYYLAPEHNARAFTSDGFYRTGDLVRLLPSGHLVVEGRAKDQINRGGDKVAAAEVEDHLLAHPAVHDAAVVAMPDAYLGERSCAFVIARDTPPRAMELLRFLRERGMAQYKIPDRIEFIDHFPKTGVGKVDKRALRERIAALLAQQPA